MNCLQHGHGSLWRLKDVAPVEIIDRFNREINAGLADPRIRARIADLGNAPLALSSAEYGKLLAEETEKWAKVVRAANIKPE
jgi:tripartite-type tricarboxylate transporter receptor subunit TctC